MGYFSSNENFIKIKFHSEMKTLSLEEKIKHYNSNLKSETLRRTKAYFEKLESQFLMISNLNQGIGLRTSEDFGLETKTKAYEEIIQLLKDYEYELIIYSIYFEDYGDKLFFSLSHLLLDSCASNFQDDYLINSFIAKYASNQTLIHKSILTDKLGLTERDWEDEDNQRNPIVGGLMSWLEEKLVSKNTDSEIKLVLFHYSKLWNVNYSKPYNENKGILLLNSLIVTLKKVLPNLKVDVDTILFELNLIFNSLLPIITLPPYLECDDTLASNSRTAVSSGYKLKKNEFNSLRKESVTYLNFEKFSIQELIKTYFLSNASLQKIIYDKITKSINEGYFITRSDIEFFTELQNAEEFSATKDSHKLIEYFCKTNYLFSNLILK